ncbi:hypothetical protein A3E45_05210 [Candidatus Daviesbacteria bacterium RIFCSPHIGHO2_12_FULL_43_11]|uniref:Uncharacterized protein n=2 Tax=Candidatus Daviesiibacteriota TaxID=1752718 RepID=A0A1F5K3V8_9BACT|nr:MAG: hypothetical protein UV33_C0047G0004 [Candidatus Daviesbacteria bacterium GW2011_GWA1_42_6]OGE20252.1 MAG: hypothetical protein A2874_03110 [Candidatus Daviesbacteria bacterium RIFCSPHIGHO2_01_FULL_43_17]OGE35606.1 MAG: hypothetical protein A3E45_05210 [Candidatus Daviesbacteria bacterium RIFCSPHIGHO2_12_FULL_43_11]OGE70641.1 MAG: hypothetical protein A3J21_02565 [Candidatus Daviesbacteria bacterium RIFCSPLOWO2_02_FULL_43_11]
MAEAPKVQALVRRLIDIGKLGYIESFDFGRVRSGLNYGSLKDVVSVFIRPWMPGTSVIKRTVLDGFNIETGPFSLIEL